MTGYTMWNKADFYHDTKKCSECGLEKPLAMFALMRAIHKEDMKSGVRPEGTPDIYCVAVYCLQCAEAMVPPEGMTEEGEEWKTP